MAPFAFADGVFLSLPLFPSHRNPLAHIEEHNASNYRAQSVRHPVKRRAASTRRKILMNLVHNTVRRHNDDRQRNSPFCRKINPHAKRHPKGKPRKTHAVNQLVRIPETRHHLNFFLGRKIPAAPKNKPRRQPPKDKSQKFHKRIIARDFDRLNHREQFRFISLGAPCLTAGRAIRGSAPAPFPVISTTLNHRERLPPPLLSLAHESRARSHPTKQNQPHDHHAGLSLSTILSAQDARWKAETEIFDFCRVSFRQEAETNTLISFLLSGRIPSCSTRLSESASCPQSAVRAG